MFKFLKGKQSSEEKEEKGLMTRLKEGLKKTRQNFTHHLAALFLGKKTIDEEVLEGIEEVLLSADVGMETTQHIIQKLTEGLKRKELNDPKIVEDTLKDSLLEILLPCQKPLTLSKDTNTGTTTPKPYVILMVGINGSGKTTSIGKLAKLFVEDGKKVLLAAGDTFRAAAIEQLQVWGERNQVPVVAQHSGADSASVIFDAFQAAIARNMDVLIADTAGRLHTQENLMDELKKVARVLAKLDATAPHEVILVLDASIGQNALIQAQKFHQAIKVSGIILTKLDGTAKGGIIFNIANSLKLPIRFIGVGEGIHDLQPFDAREFVEALFVSNNSES